MDDTQPDTCAPRIQVKSCTQNRACSLRRFQHHPRLWSSPKSRILIDRYRPGFSSRGRLRPAYVVIVSLKSSSFLAAIYRCGLETCCGQLGTLFRRGAPHNQHHIGVEVCLAHPCKAYKSLFRWYAFYSLNGPGLANGHHSRTLNQTQNAP